MLDLLHTKSPFQKITAKQIAAENNILYIPNARGKRLKGKNHNKFYAKKGMYLLLHPSNDGLPRWPIEWYANINGKPEMLMDNQHAFNCITNLNDIILQMIKLYTKYINDDVFIASKGFAIKLEDKIHPNYIGKASLVLTKDSIRNNKVKVHENIEAKKYFFNDFLDHYIGWNFGVVIKNNPELEQAIISFNELVISKGLRKYAGTGFDVICSKDVEHYELKLE